MKKRHRNDGLRKICKHSRREWPKCPDSWYLNFKPKGGGPVRLSLDRYFNRHVETKTEARQLADELRTQIRAGTFQPAKKTEDATPAAEVMTFERFATIYVERASAEARNDAARLRVLGAYEVPQKGHKLADMALADVTEDDLELFMSHLKGKGRANSTRNHYVQTIKALFRYAKRKGYLQENPITEDAELSRTKPAQRSRRLGEVEEADLLRHAPVHLQRLILAALETAMRLTELLRLQWRDVSLERRELLAKGKDQQRTIPINQRLAGVLEMARVGPDGQPFGPDAYVFGNAVGERITSIKRAWQTCVLKAHGHAPKWTKDNGLTPECQAAYQAIDLVFHDLRHEAGSRKLESGWPLHVVRDLLGHASLEQTSTYLNVKKSDLHRWMQRDDARVANPLQTDPKSSVGFFATETVDDTSKSLIQ